MGLGQQNDLFHGTEPVLSVSKITRISKFRVVGNSTLLLWSAMKEGNIEAKQELDNYGRDWRRWLANVHEL